MDCCSKVKTSPEPVNVTKRDTKWNTFNSRLEQKDLREAGSTPRRRNLKTEQGFALKMHQMFSIPSTRRERNLKMQQPCFTLGLFEESKTRAGKYHDYCNLVESFVFKMLSVHVGVFRFLRFEERFRRTTFSWRISADSRPNQRIKAPFSNSSDVMWMELKHLMRF